MRLQDKVALVTGAAGGIGLAIARRFVAEGAYVLLADRKEAELMAAARSLGDRAAAMLADVTAPADAQKLADECVRRWGGLDICVCNAGVIRAAEFLDVTLEDLDFVMNVNVRGTFLVAQAAAKAMVRGGRGGSIITLSSMTAELAMSNQLAYGASKGAVRQMTKAMALAMAPHGVRVNALGPGSIDTDIMSTITDNPKALHTVLSRIPMTRLGRPEEVAGAAVFLASEDASYVTGQTVFVDGGRLALNYTVDVPGAPRE